MAEVSRKNFAEVLKALEQIEQHLQRQSQVIATMDAVVAALVDLTGKDAVIAKTDEIAKKLAEEQQAVLAQRVEAAVVAGELEISDQISSSSFVVADEKVNENTQRGQFDVSALNPEIQEKLLGKVVGDVVELPGLTMRVKEIYKHVSKDKTPEVV